MSQLASSPTLSWDGSFGRGKSLVVASFFISGCLAVGALVVTKGDGARAAQELVTRFSCLLFLASLAVGPLARILPVRSLVTLAQMGGNLKLAFVATSVFSLACFLMPSAVAGDALSVSAVLYIGLNGLVLLVLLFPASRAATQLLGVACWRAIQLIAIAYFWTSFLVSAIIHITRQNESGVWDPLVLTLLIATLGLIVAARLAGEARS